MGDITKKDLELIGHLRKNARIKVTDLAKKVNIPATTIYEKIRKHEKKGIILKHVAHVDFEKFGYTINIYFAIRVRHEYKEKLMHYLLSHKNINSLFKIDFEYDFLGSAYFRDDKQSNAFFELLYRQFPVLEIVKYHIQQELMTEELLTNQNEEISELTQNNN